MSLFSSSELIHLVFSNENDLYYCDDLTVLDQHQYLWRILRKQYRTVFFLSQQVGRPMVRTFGEAGMEHYSPTQKWGLGSLFGGKTETERFGSWLVRQLCPRSRSHEGAAIVCSLEDLCLLFQGRQWDETLREIARADRCTGILVITVPAVAERSMGALLESNVFDRLGEIAVTGLRSGAERPLFIALENSKPDSCLSLHGFTRDRVESLLLHLVFNYPERFQGSVRLKEMTTYLTQYLNNPRLRRAEPLMGTGQLSSCPLYREVFQQMRDTQAWNRLDRQSRRAAEAGGIEAYLDRRGIPQVQEGQTVLVTRSRESVAGKCLALWPPYGLEGTDGPGERALDILEEIQFLARQPMNRKENETVVRKAEAFLITLEAAQSRGSLETYKRALYALRFCLQRIYTPPSGEEQLDKVLNTLEAYLNVSDQYDDSCTALESFRRQATQGALQEKKLRQMEDTVAAYGSVLLRYDDLVRASVVTLSLADSAWVTEQAMRLSEELRTFHEGNIIRNEANPQKSGQDVEEEILPSLQRELTEEEMAALLSDPSLYDHRAPKIEEYGPKPT